MRDRNKKCASRQRQRLRQKKAHIIHCNKMVRKWRPEQKKNFMQQCKCNNKTSINIVILRPASSLKKKPTAMLKLIYGRWLVWLFSFQLIQFLSFSFLVRTHKILCHFVLHTRIVSFTFCEIFDPNSLN